MRASSLSLIKKGELYVSASKALSLVEIDGVYKKKNDNVIVYHEYVEPDLTHTSLQEPFIREYKQVTSTTTNTVDCEGAWVVIFGAIAFGLGWSFY